jgi:DNA invertase Pin-like site-specific DNA recombinase
MLIAENWDEMLRVAASLKYGHVTASLIVGKLSRADRQNTLAAALKEYGGLRRTDIMAAFAELERDMIHQRTMAGLATARAQGRVGGRPSVMDPDKVAAATARLARGESPTQIAKALGVSRATLYRHTDVVTTRVQS